MHEPSISRKPTHHSFISLWKSRCWNQNLSNLNECLTNSPSRPHSRHIGQWSKPVAGNTIAPISPPPTKADSKTRKRSSWEAICRAPKRLFCQVKSPLVVQTSTSCNSSISLLKEVVILLRALTPPFFSSRDLMRLMSPSRIHYSCPIHSLVWQISSRKETFWLGWNGSFTSVPKIWNQAEIKWRVAHVFVILTKFEF